jgi:acyl-CoA synthetase (AMP-forming)/AMP-acid ligase II
MVHIAGLMIGLLNPLAQGATVVVLPKFVPEEFLLSIQKYRVHCFVTYENFKFFLIVSLNYDYIV